MNQEEWEQAALFWQERDHHGKQMPVGSLGSAYAEWITNHNTCALATGCGDFVRCTPLEYFYADGCFWIFSEGGQKFKALAGNKRVSLAVYENYTGFGNLNSVQVTGTAEVIEAASQTYLWAANLRHLTDAALEKMDHPLYLIKITPLHAEMLCSDFKKQGFAVRQHLDFI